MYEQRYPEVDDVVMVEVKSIAEMGKQSGVASSALALGARNWPLDRNPYAALAGRPDRAPIPSARPRRTHTTRRQAPGARFWRIRPKRLLSFSPFL